MLVTFKTKAHADITLFGDVATTLLKMMGHSATIPGAILAADIPVAISRLTTAIEAEKSSLSNIDHDANESEVTMIHRSLPLFELLNTAAKKGCNVMWE